MAELREAHLRCLLAVYELGRSKPGVGTQDIAKALSCSKASVTKMMGILVDMDLLVRERYGKIYLTDTGFLLARDLFLCVEGIRERLPAMGLGLTEEEVEEYIRVMVMNLPESSGREGLTLWEKHGKTLSKQQTTVHGKGAGFRLRARLLTLSGFKVYSKWTVEGFETFVSEHNFQIRQTALLGGSLAPLCDLEASIRK